MIDSMVLEREGVVPQGQRSSVTEFSPSVTLKRLLNPRE